MADPVQMPPTPMKKPDPDPHNLQATKRYVFNETGNIMMASTEIGSEEIEQSVRDVFAEVSVFFAAMTRAMATTINPITKTHYSIYDYEAIEGIVNGSGLFIQVSEEDVTHSISSWGATVSKELIEGLLGLATGSGELAFAQGLVSSIGKQGLKISGNSDKQDGRVGTIVFVCEYLLGMPVVSALVCYVDSKKASQSFQLGPCIKEQSSTLHMTMHKDTYMFVTPNFIKKYAGDLLSVESDLQYLQLVDYLQDLVERKPTVTAVETAKGDTALSQLTIGTTYYILGVFLGGKTGGTYVAKSTKTGVDMNIGNPQNNVVAITPSTVLGTPEPIGIYFTPDATTAEPHPTEELVATTPGSFTAAASASSGPTLGAPPIVDSAGAAAPATLVQGTTYTIQGTNLLGGHSASSVTVDTASGSQAVKVGTPTNTAIKFKTSATFTGEKIEVKSGAATLVATAPLSST